MLKKLIRLNDKKFRNELGLFVVEGEKFVKDIGSDFEIVEYVFSESYLAKSRGLKNGHVFSDDDFIKIADTKTPQGILAVVKQKAYSLESVMTADNSFVILGENINDPGNIGTIIRTADACSANGVIFTNQSADIYNPKVIRSAAGSFCHMPVIQNVDLSNVVSLLKERNIKLIAASLKGKTLPYDINLSDGIAILLGNESNGLTEEAESLADILVKIPMIGRAESLNASIAGGVLMYEVVRQRLMPKL